MAATSSLPTCPAVCKASPHLLALLLYVCVLVCFVCVCGCTSVQRPDLTLDAVAVTNVEGVVNLYSTPATSDYYVAGRLPWDNPTAQEVPLLNANTDIVSFPVAASALVPVYNVPEIGTTIPLLLSRSALAKIFLGEINMWNDSILVALNPALTLPNMPITVVLPGVTEMSAFIYIFMKAMAKFEPTWTAKMGPADDFWPNITGLPYANMVRATDLTGPASYVGANAYTIGFSDISVAYDLEVSIADMYNKVRAHKTHTTHAPARSKATISTRTTPTDLARTCLRASIAPTQFFQKA